MFTTWNAFAMSPQINDLTGILMKAHTHTHIRTDLNDSAHTVRWIVNSEIDTRETTHYDRKQDNGDEPAIECTLLLSVEVVCVASEI